MKTRDIFLLLLCGTFFGAQIQAAEIIQPKSVLTLDQCIRIGLRNHPDISAAADNIRVYQARVGQARSGNYPRLDSTAGYTRARSTPSPLSNFANGVEYDQYTAGLQLTQNIFDFGKVNSQVRIQRLNRSAAESDLKTTTNRIVLGIKQTYYNLLKAERNRRVAEDSVKSFTAHLDQANGFFSVGRKPRFDVTKAKVDLSTAQLDLIKAENALKLARVGLNDAMGVPAAGDYSIVDNLGFQKYDLTEEQAVEQAWANRPDLKSIAYLKDAAEESLKLAQKQYLPVLSGNAAYNLANDTLPLKNGWMVGLAISLPIFDGFLTKYQIAESRANRSFIRDRELSLKQSVLLEIHQAYLGLKEAEDSIAAMELTVREAKENYDIAQGRYGAGVGNPIEVTDAQVTYVGAQKNYVETLYQYQVSRETLKNAMGLQ